MGYIERKEEALMKKIIPQDMMEDFESFWTKNVSDLRSKPIEFTKTKIKTPYDKTFTTYEIIFNTIDDTKVYAYFSHPNNMTKKLPCVVAFGGGGSQRDIYPQFVSTGVCCLSVDNRAQGGLTVDKADYDWVDNYHGKPGANMSNGILNKDNYYLRNLYLDAVRAVDVASLLDEVDSEKIVTYGMSQGGALAITAAALSGKVLRTFPVVPSYSCMQRRIEAGSGVLSAVQSYIFRYPEKVDKVFETLSYFDMLNMVSLLKVPAAYNLGLSDPICIPEFVYSVYYHTKSEKEIHFAPFVGHNISLDYLDFMLNEFAKL